MKILYINANAKPEDQSRTLQLGRTFVNECKSANSDVQIDEINLYDYEVDFLRGEDLMTIFSGADNRIKTIAEDFASYDKYVIAAPMWNLNVPAILHAFIDYVSYVNVTFKYTETGPVGLLTGKKAVFISTTGGVYDTPETIGYNFGRSYIHGIFGFFGVEMQEDLILSGTNFYPEAVLNENYAKLEAEVKTAAQKF